MRIKLAAAVLSSTVALAGGHGHGETQVLRLEIERSAQLRSADKTVLVLLKVKNTSSDVAFIDIEPAGKVVWVQNGEGDIGSARATATNTPEESPRCVAEDRVVGLLPGDSLLVPAKLPGKVKRQQVPVSALLRLLVSAGPQTCSGWSEISLQAAASVSIPSK